MAQRKPKSPQKVVTFHVDPDRHEEIRLFAHSLGTSVAVVGRALFAQALYDPTASQDVLDEYLAALKD